MPRDHGVGDLGYLLEESVLRPIVFERLRRVPLTCLRGLCLRPGLTLAHHAFPERWRSSAEGSLSNSRSAVLSHWGSTTMRGGCSRGAGRHTVTRPSSAGALRPAFGLAQ